MYLWNDFMQLSIPRPVSQCRAWPVPHWPKSSNDLCVIVRSDSLPFPIQISLGVTTANYASSVKNVGHPFSTLPSPRLQVRSYDAIKPSMEAGSTKTRPRRGLLSFMGNMHSALNVTSNRIDPNAGGVSCCVYRPKPMTLNLSPITSVLHQAIQAISTEHFTQSIANLTARNVTPQRLNEMIWIPRIPPYNLYASTLLRSSRPAASIYGYFFCVGYIYSINGEDLLYVLHLTAQSSTSYALASVLLVTSVFLEHKFALNPGLRNCFLGFPKCLDSIPEGSMTKMQKSAHLPSSRLPL